VSTVPEQVKQLFELFQAGAITREEYDDQKAALLAGGLEAAGQTGSQPKLLTEVGAYRLTGLIGEGGMGAVYRGRHRTEARALSQGGDVAVKVMHPQYARNDEYRGRFEREASLGMTLDDPHIVKVHDLVVDGGTLALVMELVDGQPLSAQVGEVRGPIPWNQVRPMSKALLGAVGRAHDRGVVHRDLKPDNILITADGAPHVIDFGIARGLDGPSTATGTGMGTIEYMAPEQYTDAKGVDSRADVYSLGMILYEMLAGRLPWEAGATPYQIMQHKADRQLVSPAAFCPDIPPEIVEGLAPALAARPEDRYPSTEAFGAALEAATARAVGREEQQRLAAEAAQRQEAERAAATAIPEAPPPPQPPHRRTVVDPAAVAPPPPPSPRADAGGPSRAEDNRGDVPRARGRFRVFVLVGLVLAVLGILCSGTVGVLYAQRPYRLVTDPAGAEVVVGTSGEVLGTAPFQWSGAEDVPSGGVCLSAEGYWATCVRGPQLVESRKTVVVLAPAPEIAIASDPPEAQVQLILREGDREAESSTLGWTPVTWEVPGELGLPGAATVELRARKEGRAPAVVELTPEDLSGGAPILIRLDPASTLRVTSRPSGASVGLAGPSIVTGGVTPLDLDDLPEGEYVVAVSKAGYGTVERSVSLGVGVDETLYVRLSRGSDGTAGGDATAGDADPGASGSDAAAEVLADLAREEAQNNLFGTDGIGVGASAFVGGVIGSQYGNQYGSGGLGTQSDGASAEDSGEGLGGLGTRGRDRGASGYGTGGGYFGRKSSGTPGMSTGDPIILGAMDKSVIDQVIKQHLAQIRYCYQKELNKNPQLHGKIVIKFVIAKDGSVSSAKTHTTSMNNSIVENCICQRFMRFQFPEATGGGIVIVTYPFVFKSG